MQLSKEYQALLRIRSHIETLEWSEKQYEKEWREREANSTDSEIDRLCSHYFRGQLESIRVEIEDLKDILEDVKHILGCKSMKEKQ